MPAARALILVTFASLLAMPAHAQRTEIYKCRDPDGRWTYTDDKRRAEKEKCEVVTSHINVAPPPAPAKQQSRSPSSFPKETANDRASAKGRQRDILEKELAAEEQDLTKAKQALAEQQSVRSGDERNYARVLERLQPLKDRVETHEKNVEALKRELANLGR
jgi:chromosome segregation ATPase